MFSIKYNIMSCTYCEEPTKNIQLIVPRTFLYLHPQRENFWKHRSVLLLSYMEKECRKQNYELRLN